MSDLLLVKIVKSFFFISHIVGIITTNLGWLYTPNIVYPQLIVVSSWYLNQNECLLSMLEYRLFGETIMGNSRKFRVPRRHRMCLYLNIGLGLGYNFGGFV